MPETVPWSAEEQRQLEEMLGIIPTPRVTATEPTPVTVPEPTPETAPEPVVTLAPAPEVAPARVEETTGAPVPVPVIDSTTATATAAIATTVSAPASAAKPDDPNAVPHPAYVSRLVAGVKRKLAVTLGQCSLVVGANGAGKSALIDALGLVLTGSASRGLGARPATIKRALPEGETCVEVTARLEPVEDDACKKFETRPLRSSQSARGVLSWKLTGAKPDWLRDGVPLVGPPGSFCQAGTLDILLGADRNRMLAMLRAAGIEIPVQRLRSYLEPLPPPVKEKLVQLLGVPEAPETVLYLKSAAFCALLDAASTAKHAASKELSAYVDEDLLPLSEAEEEELIRYENTVASSGVPDRVAAEAASVRKELEHATEAQGVILARYAGNEADIEAMGRLMAWNKAAHSAAEYLTSVTSKNAAIGAIPCPCCWRPADFETLRQSYQKLEAFMAGIAGRNPDVLTVPAQAKAAQERVTAISARLIEVESRKTEVRATIDTVRLVQLRQRRARCEIIRAGATRSGELKNEIDRLTSLEKHLSKAAADVLTDACQIVQRRASRVMPKGASIQLSVDGEKVVPFLVTTGSPPRHFAALGGAEQSLFVSVLSAALGGYRETQVSVLVVNEVWIDPGSIRKMLVALDEARGLPGGPTQVIVCVVEYSGKVPEGWTLINLDPPKPVKEKAVAPPALEAAPAPAAGSASESPPVAAPEGAVVVKKKRRSKKADEPAPVVASPTTLLEPLPLADIDPFTGKAAVPPVGDLEDDDDGLDWE